jgi:hypothetical protein
MCETGLSTTNGGPYATGFGYSVALDGDRALVGFADNMRGQRCHVYERSGTNWTVQAVLRPWDACIKFGVAVSLSGDLAIVGTAAASVGPPQPGAAYVFKHSGGTWNRLHKVSASDATGFNGFGQAVSISGSNAVVGACLEANDAGAAYAYEVGSVQPHTAPSVTRSRSSR